MSSPEDNTPPEKQPDANEAKAPTPESSGSPQEAAKPKFKVTRSPFAPKVGDDKKSAAMPKPSSAPEPSAPEAPAANAPVPFPEPEKEATPKPAAKEAPKPTEPAPQKAKPVAASPVSPKKPFPSAPPKAAASAPVGIKPKPMAPLTARKAAEVEAEEESKVNPLALAADVIAAAVALTFAVLIVLALKG